MVIISDNGEFATSVAPYLNPITGGLGSGAGQNNPGGGYSTPVEPTYTPPVSYGPSVEYAPSADPTGRWARYNGGEWVWENTPYDPSKVTVTPTPENQQQLAQTPPTPVTSFAAQNPEAYMWQQNPQAKLPIPPPQSMLPSTTPYANPQQQFWNEQVPQRGGGFLEEIASPVMQGVDLAMFPSDYVSEIAGNIFSPVSMQGVASGGQRTSGSLPEHLLNPGMAVEDFRDRPWEQQLLLGAIADPLNVFGGPATDLLDLGATAARPLIRNAGRYGEDVLTGLAKTAPSPVQILPPVSVEEIPIPAIGGAAEFRAGDKVKALGIDQTVVRDSGGRFVTLEDGAGHVNDINRELIKQPENAFGVAPAHAYPAAPAPGQPKGFAPQKASTELPEDTLGDIMAKSIILKKGVQGGADDIPESTLFHAPISEFDAPRLANKVPGSTIGIEGTPAPTRPLFEPQPLENAGPISGARTAPLPTDFERVGNLPPVAPRDAPPLTFEDAVLLDATPVSGALSNPLPSDFDRIGVLPPPPSRPEAPPLSFDDINPKKPRKLDTGSLPSKINNAAQQLFLMGDPVTAGLHGHTDLFSFTPSGVARWLGGVKNALKSAAHPEVLDSFMREFSQQLDGIEYLLSSRVAKRHPNIFGKDTIDMQRSVLEDIPIAGKIPKIDRAFNEGFVSYLRGKWMEDAFRAQALKNGKLPISNRQIDDIVARASHRSGTTLTHANPILNLALIAPRFYASTFQNIFDAVKLRGVAGADARWALGKAALGGIGATMGINMAATGGRDLWGPGLGHDIPTTKEDWDKLFHNGNFMRVRYGSNDFSLFGPYDFVGRWAFKEMGNALVGDKMGAWTDTLDTATNRASLVAQFGLHAYDAARGTRAWDTADELKGMAPLVRELFMDTGAAINELRQGNIKEGLTDLSSTALKGSTLPRAGDVTPWDRYNEKVTNLGLKDDNGKLITNYSNADEEQQKLIREKLGTPPEYTGIGITTPQDAASDALRTAYETTKTEAANTLKTRIASGITGEDLRDAISTYKNETRVAAETAFRDLPAKDTKSRQDYWGDLYWTTEMPMLADGTPDFDGFKTLRAEVLEEARANGVDPSYITARDGYRNETNSKIDPAIRDIIWKLEDDRAAIDASGYWDLKDKAWTELNKQAPAPGYVGGQGFYEFRDAEVAKLKQELIASGMPAGSAATEAEELVDTRHPIIKKFNDAYKTRYLYPWVDSHVDELLLLREWGYMSNPDEKIEKFLLSKGY